MEAAKVEFHDNPGQGKQVTLISSDNFISVAIHGKPQVIVCEIYPLSHLDKDVLSSATKNELNIRFLSALDSKFFDRFGDGKFIDLMKKLGFSNDDIITNKIVSKSISTVQGKVEEDIENEIKEATSIDAWMKVNISNN